LLLFNFQFGCEWNYFPNFILLLIYRHTIDFVFFWWMWGLNSGLHTCK
jgi:hypothetical protein